jgi:hypothetical protein
MTNRILLLGLLLGGASINAQTINETNAAGKTGQKVGINTTIPTRTLTIKNSTANDGKPLLRLVDSPVYSKNVGSAMDADLGGNTATSTNYTDYRPLVVDKVGDVYQGLPIHNMSILTLTISNVEGDWIAKFDTGIDHNKYAVAIMSAFFKLPAKSGNDLVMLTGNSGVPNATNGSSTSARIAPPTVILKKDGNNWVIEADYDNMSPEKFTKDKENRGISGKGKNVDGTWVISLLVGRRDAINFTELEFSQGGNNSGTGITDNTYKTGLENFLKKLE